MRKILLMAVITSLSFINISFAQVERQILEKSEYEGEWIFLPEEVSLNCSSGRVTIYNYDNDKEYP